MPNAFSTLDAENSPPARIGDVVASKYRLDRVLGSGGMGVVFAATHLDLDVPVAIKMLRPAAAANPATVDRFAREARACARLQSENVVRVTDIGTLDSGVPYIVMEYLEGADLEQVLRTLGPLPVGDAIDCILQACAGLAEAHAAGVVHRDLKPANLFLARRPDADGVVKVLDFGIAKIRTADNLTKTGDLMGSPLYMSPEQLTSARDADPRADVWALGVILYEMLAGAPPFDGETMPQVCTAVLVTAPAPIAERRAGLPAAVGAIVAKCLQKEPTERYASVLALAEALAEVAPARSAPTIARIAHLASGTPSGEALSRRSVIPPRAPSSVRAAMVASDAPMTNDVTSVIPRPLGRQLALPAFAIAVVAVIGLAAWLRPSPPAAGRAEVATQAAAPPIAASAAAPMTLPLVSVSAPLASASEAPDAGAAPRTKGAAPRNATSKRAGSEPSLESQIRAAFPGAGAKPATAPREDSASPY